MMSPIAFGNGNLGLNVILLLLTIVDLKLMSPLSLKGKIISLHESAAHSAWYFFALFFYLSKLES